MFAKKLVQGFPVMLQLAVDMCKILLRVTNL